jgi:hypothetical protein
MVSGQRLKAAWNYSEGRIPGQETIISRQKSMLLLIHTSLIFPDRYVEFVIILKLLEACSITGKLIGTIDIIPSLMRGFFDSENELYIVFF